MMSYIQHEWASTFDAKRRARELANSTLTIDQRVEYSQLLNLLCDLSNPVTRVANVKTTRWDAIKTSFIPATQEDMTAALKGYFIKGR
jgi:hypothetical protein